MLFEPVFFRALYLSHNDQVLLPAKRFFVAYAERVTGGEPAAVGEMIDYWFGAGSFAQMHPSALTEMMAGILLLVPATTAYAAAYLTLVCVGALIAQAFVLHGDVIHAIVLAVILGLIAWNGRPARAA